jgi:hypothetical protein
MKRLFQLLFSVSFAGVGLSFWYFVIRPDGLVVNLWLAIGVPLGLCVVGSIFLFLALDRSAST